MTCISSQNVAMRKLRNEWFVRDTRSGRFFYLDGSGSRLWDLLVECDHPTQAVEGFARLHDQSFRERAAKDAEEMIMDLKTFGLLCSSSCSERAKPQRHSTLEPIDGTIQDRMRQAAHALGKPLLVEYEMTYRCNLRCRYCYQPNYLKHMRDGELSPSEILEMLDNFEEAGVFFLVVTGGECTLVRNFPLVIREARRRYMDVSVLTNGTAISQPIISLLSESGVSEVKVSVYGGDRNEYEEFTGRSAAYDRTMAGICALREAGLNVIAKLIVTSFHEGTWKGSLEDLRGLSVPVEVSAHVMPAMDGDLYPLKYRVSTETLRELAGRGLIKSGGGRVCTAGTLKFRISPDGSITTCELIRTSIGNIRTDRLCDVAMSSTASKLTQYVSSNAARMRDDAATTGLPCPALAKIEHGSWSQTSVESKRWTEVFSTQVERDSVSEH